MMSNTSMETARVVVYPFGSHLAPAIGDGKVARVSCDAAWESTAVVLFQVAYPGVQQGFVSTLDPSYIQIFLLPNGEEIDDAGK
jgi:hypothetical protein